MRSCHLSKSAIIYFLYRSVQFFTKAAFWGDALTNRAIPQTLLSTSLLSVVLVFVEKATIETMKMTKDLSTSVKILIPVFVVVAMTAANLHTAIQIHRVRRFRRAAASNIKYTSSRSIDWQDCAPFRSLTHSLFPLRIYRMVN